MVIKSFTEKQLINMEKSGYTKEDYLKWIAIGAAVVVVALIVALIWIWSDRNKMVGEMTLEKEYLTEQMLELREEYDELSSTSDSLNAELEREREKVEQLIDRVKRTEATNRSKIREYEAELGTLRAIMRSYIVQIDSLNTLNISLRQDAAKARQQARESRERYDQLKTTADELGKKVEVGALVKGRGFSLVAINAKNKDTDRSSRTVKLKGCFYLVENSIAERGIRNIYIRVKGPDGVLITTSQDQLFTSNGEQMIYSAVREVDYQGDELEICIFYGAPDEQFIRGLYVVDFFTEEGLLGSADTILR